GRVSSRPPPSQYSGGLLSPCPLPQREGLFHVRRLSSRAWPAGTPGPAADPILQHRLLLLLPARPTVHAEDVAGHSGANLPLGLRRRPRPRTLHPALARRRAARAPRLLLRDGGRTAAPAQRRQRPDPPVLSDQRHAARRPLVRVLAAPGRPPRYQRGRPGLP